MIRCTLLALCILLLAACTFPGTVRPTVKIGLSAPFEGLYRDLGYEVLYAVRLAVRERNEAGGVGNRYLVELVALNDFNEPEEAALQVREMAADTGLLGAIGGWTAETARAAGEQSRLPLLTPDADEGELGVEAARFAALSLGARRAAVLHDQAPESRDLAAAFEAGFAGQGGQILSSITPGSDGWATVVAAARPDVLVIFADAESAADWAVQMRQAGFQGQILGGPSFGSSIVPKIAGSAVESALYVSPYAPVPDDPAFVTAYESLSGGVAPGPVAAWAYGAATDLLDAIAAADLETAADLSRFRAEEATDQQEQRLGSHIYRIEAGQVFCQP